MSGTCTPHHDWFNASLTAALCLGIALSYAPQLHRIIKSRSSEGFSPLFLLLGSTCSSAGMLNMVSLQWGIVRCCRYVSMGSCLEMTGGIFQVGIQWAFFSSIFVLYMIYYPPHLKYTSGTSTEIDTHESRAPVVKVFRVLSTEWRLSLISAWTSVAFLLISFFITMYLLLLLPPLQPPVDAPFPIPTPTPTPSPELPPLLLSWATFLGVSSALLAAIQYTPQLVHTYKHKVVGALSIPTMCIQSPGSAIMVLSIALRPGTNWTSWITFAVSGVLQSGLLVMCILWTFRQRKLGVDDFGNPLNRTIESSQSDDCDVDPIPGLVTAGENPVVVRKALARAVESAVGSDLLSGTIVTPYEVEDGEETPLPVGEATPLLGASKAKKGKSFTSWFN